MDAWYELNKVMAALDGFSGDTAYDKACNAITELRSSRSRIAELEAQLANTSSKERERIYALSLEFNDGECTCDEAFKGRRLIDPECDACNGWNDFREAIKKLED